MSENKIELTQAEYFELLQKPVMAVVKELGGKIDSLDGKLVDYENTNKKSLEEQGKRLGKLETRMSNNDLKTNFVLWICGIVFVADVGFVIWVVKEVILKYGN